MARTKKTHSITAQAGDLPWRSDSASQIRRNNHLKDEVYREMLLLESKRPGSEMGLALALLRAVVHSAGLPESGEFGEWLQSVCPVGLRMIEVALEQGWSCDFKTT